MVAGKIKTYSSDTITLIQQYQLTLHGDNGTPSLDGWVSMSAGTMVLSVLSRMMLKRLLKMLGKKLKKMVLGAYGLALPLKLPTKSMERESLVEAAPLVSNDLVLF
jgi:hypothetical protein